MHVKPKCQGKVKHGWSEGGSPSEVSETQGLSAAAWTWKAEVTMISLGQIILSSEQRQRCSEANKDFLKVM